MARARPVSGPALLAAVAVIALASVAGWWLGGVARSDEPLVRVDEVVDGDTIVVRFGDGSTDTVRLLGVDTPETKHPTKGVQCFGPEASTFTGRRLTGRAVRLEPDVERRDRYGRLLAFVHLGDVRFNDELLRRGYARLLVIPPNGAYARDLLAAELSARRHHRGLWGRCPARP